MNAEISLHWIQQIFDLLTDGLATHESLEVLTFCHDNNIILCRLPSHTFHKLQPCDVGVFGPLKTAYREQVEQLFYGGANTVGKQHFTLLYDRAGPRRSHANISGLYDAKQVYFPLILAVCSEV